MLKFTELTPWTWEQSYLEFQSNEKHYHFDHLLAKQMLFVLYSKYFSGDLLNVGSYQILWEATCQNFWVIRPQDFGSNSSPHSHTSCNDIFKQEAI